MLSASQGNFAFFHPLSYTEVLYSLYYLFHIKKKLKAEMDVFSALAHFSVGVWPSYGVTKEVLVRIYKEVGAIKYDIRLWCRFWIEAVCDKIGLR